MAEQKKEDEEPFLEKVQHPDPNDILCGKDKNCVHAPGSIRFRKIIESYRQRYANCLTKFDKMLITKEIYETLSDTSRFLKYNTKEKVWEEISPMAARDKCGHALRFANRIKTKTSKKKSPAGQQYAAPTVMVSVAPTAATTPPTAPMATIPKTVSPVGAPLPALVPAPAAAPTAASVAASMSPTTAAAVASLTAQQSNLLQATTAPAPSVLPQTQQLWGELAKRYNTMWNASQIPSTLAGSLRAPLAAPAPSGVLNSSHHAITALAAAAVRNNPSALVAAITNNAPAGSLVAPPPIGTAASTATTAAVNALQQQALLNAMAAASKTHVAAHAPGPSAAASALVAAAAAVQNAASPRRKPTLDDLCSILKSEQVYANAPAAGN